MISSHKLLLAAAIAAVVGCSTLSRARDAQKAHEAKGRGETAAVAKVSLKGESLESLVRFALTNRPSVVSARLAVEDARLAMKSLATEAPVLSEYPWAAAKLNASANYGETSTPSTMSDHDWEMDGGPSAALSLDLLVYDFGRYSARASEQAEKTVAAELELAQQGYVVFNEVATSYFDFYEKCALLQVAMTNEAQYADHLDRTEAWLEAGEAYRLDVLKARLDLANARQSTVAASNAVATAGATLMNALGIDESRGTWESVIGADRAGIDAVRRGFMRSSVGNDDAYELARTNSPSVAVRRARLRAASHAVDYAVADMMPNVTVSGSLSWTDPLWIWKWGLSVAKTFQFYRHLTPVDRARVALEAASVAVDEAEQQLSVELELAIANRDNSDAAFDAAMASLRSAKENLGTVMEQFQIGDVSRIELSDAIASYSSARGTVIKAFYDGQRAETKLFSLLGRYPDFHEKVIRSKER